MPGSGDTRTLSAFDRLDNDRPSRGQSTAWNMTLLLLLGGCLLYMSQSTLGEAKFYMKEFKHVLFQESLDRSEISPSSLGSGGASGPNVTQTQPRLPKIVFTGVFRNSNAKNPAFYKKLFALAKAITSEYHILVYENDSHDNTREVLLKNLGGNSSHVTMLLEDNVTDHKLPEGTEMHHNNLHKTTRIARARNIVLRYAEDHFSHYDYFAMMDMDMLCIMDPSGGVYDHNIFKYVLLELSDRWDVLSFRQTPYFDWWALRYPPMLPDNFLFHQLKKNKKGPMRYGWPAMDVMIDKDFRNAPFPDGLIEVESAFALFTIYKMSFLRQKKARYRGVDEENVTDCEHVAFNTDLLKMGARIRISPLSYSKPGWLGRSNRNHTYRPLPPDIEARMKAITN